MISASWAARTESRRAVSALKQRDVVLHPLHVALADARAGRPTADASTASRAPQRKHDRSLGRDEVVAAGRHLELVAAVLGPGGLVGARVSGRSSP